MSGILLLFWAPHNATIPYHTIPYHTIPYHTIPYRTVPYQMHFGLQETHVIGWFVGSNARNSCDWMVSGFQCCCVLPFCGGSNFGGESWVIAPNGAHRAPVPPWNGLLPPCPCTHTQLCISTLTLCYRCFLGTGLRLCKSEGVVAGSGGISSPICCSQALLHFGGCGSRKHEQTVCTASTQESETPRTRYTHQLQQRLSKGPYTCGHEESFRHFTDICSSGESKWKCKKEQ